MGEYYVDGTLIHVGQKNYKCNYCSYASTQSDKLENHKQTHQMHQTPQMRKRTYNEMNQ